MLQQLKIQENTSCGALFLPPHIWSTEWIFSKIFLLQYFCQPANIWIESEYIWVLVRIKFIYHYSASLVPHSLMIIILMNRYAPIHPLNEPGQTPTTSILDRYTQIFISYTDLFLYFLVSLISCFYREIFGSAKSVNNNFKGAREHGRLIRQKC